MIGKKGMEGIMNRINKIMLDIIKVQAINVSLMKLIMNIVNNCQKSGIRLSIVGLPSAKERLKGFAETIDLTFDNSAKEVKSAFQVILFDFFGGG